MNIVPEATQACQATAPPDLLAAASMPTMLDSALAYAAQGISILPKLKGDKYSGIDGWQHVFDPTERTIRAWYGSGKYDGIAVKPGAHSRNLAYIDADGSAAFDLLLAQFPELATTYTERTGSGNGYHVFIQVGTLPTLDTGKITRKGILGTDNLGLELFFNSGAVVVAPSIHPNGNRYTVHNPAAVLHVDTLDQYIAWLLTLETKADRQRKARQATAGQGKVYDGTRAPRGAGIAPALIDDIERILGVTRFDANGWSKPIPCIMAQHEHDDARPAAAWNTKHQFFTCRKCDDTINAHTTAETLSLDVNSYYESRQNAPESTRKHAGPLQTSAKIAPQTSDPVVTWGDHRKVNLYDPIVAKIAAAMGDQPFTVAEYATRIGRKDDAARAQIYHALEWGDVTEVEPRSANFSSTLPIEKILEKNTERQPAGAAVGQQYRLSIDYDRIWERLLDIIPDLGEYAETDIISIRRLREAGEAQLTAKSLNVIIRETYFSEAGERLNQNAIERAKAEHLRIWRECEADDQPAQIDNPNEVSEALLRHHFESIPADQPILQRDLVWIAGVKRRNVGNKIKNAGLVPAANPTFVDVAIDDKRHGYKGAKVAYLDERHEIICGAAEKQPKKAAFVRLNIGKTYSPAPAAMEKTDPPAERKTKPTPTPADAARREYRRQRRELRRKIEGTMIARGFKKPSVPFAKWQRGDLVYENTWAGMVDALLENDLDWANEQRRKRLLRQRQARRKPAHFAELIGAAA